MITTGSDRFSDDFITRLITKPSLDKFSDVAVPVAGLLLLIHTVPVPAQATHWQLQLKCYFYQYGATVRLIFKKGNSFSIFSFIACRCVSRAGQDRGRARGYRASCITPLQSRTSRPSETFKLADDLARGCKQKVSDQLDHAADSKTEHLRSWCACLTSRLKLGLRSGRPGHDLYFWDG